MEIPPDQQNSSNEINPPLPPPPPPSGPISNPPDPGDSNEPERSSSADRLISDRIKELNEAISEAKTAFEQNAEELVTIIFLWAVGCIAVGIFFAAFLATIYNSETPASWIELISKSVIKILISGTFLALATYLFNMLSMYVQLYQSNRKKQAILGSFASFVEAANKEQRNVIFIKLVETVISSNSEVSSPKFKDNEELIKLIRELEEKIIKA